MLAITQTYLFWPLLSRCQAEFKKMDSELAQRHFINLPFRQPFDFRLKSNSTLIRITKPAFVLNPSLKIFSGWKSIG
jgi:hypothetical protein